MKALREMEPIGQEVGEKGGDQGGCLHRAGGECHQGPETLLLFSQLLQKETKMNTEVSSLRGPI